ncbi:MAG: hypothetical protein V1659_00625 [Candidatus Woesearchaeota archaeon]
MNKKRLRIIGKKATDITVIVAIVSVLITIIIGAAIYSNFSKGVLNTFNNREFCQKSAMHHGLKLNVLQREGFVPLNCQTFELVFHDKYLGVMNSLDEDQKEDKIDPIKGKDYIREEDVKFFVAEEIRKCWQQFLEGQSDVFDRAGVFTPESTKKCFVCNTFQFDEKLGERMPQVTGFYEYIKDPANKPRGTTAATYYEYITPETTEGQILKNPWKTIIEEKIDSENIVFDTSKTYSIIFAKWSAGFLETWRNNVLAHLFQFNTFDAYEQHFKNDKNLIESKGDFFVWVADISELNEYCNTWVG